MPPKFARGLLGRVERLATKIFSALDDDGLPTRATANSTARLPRVSEIMRLRALVEKLNLEDLQIDPAVLRHNMDRMRCASEGAVIFFDLFRSPQAQVTLLLLAPKTRLQLHDHQGMVVISKVMHGILNFEVAAALSPTARTENINTGATQESSAGLETARDISVPASSEQKQTAAIKGPTLSMIPCDDEVSEFGYLSRVPNAAKARRANGSSDPLFELSLQYMHSFDPSLVRASANDSVAEANLRQQMLGGSACLECSRRWWDPSTVCSEQNCTDLHKIDVALLAAGAMSAASGQRSVATNDSDDRVSATAAGATRARDASGLVWCELLCNESFPTSIVATPKVANLHSFWAPDNDICVFLDVVAPPYQHPPLRSCQYFEPIFSLDDRRRILLCRTLNAAAQRGSYSLQLSSTVVPMFMNGDSTIPMRIHSFSTPDNDSSTDDSAARSDCSG